jgi:TRAP transporter 4TM/12TM fusion protein|tara:strand:+ start:3790 stop:5685 length:1896 start_codon:yes stop_codon:yes gene_type:complete
MSTSAQKETNAWIKIAKMLVTITFSVLIIYTIVIALIDEVISRYGAIGFGLAIVLLSNPLAHSLPVGDRRRGLAWGVDGLLVLGFAYATWWFVQIHQQLWTGFYIPSNNNLIAGTIGLLCILEATRRAWGWSLVLLVLFFTVFGFAGPHLPNALKHFGMDVGNFMQIAWYSFDGVFGRTTGLVANTVLIFLIFGAMLEHTGAGQSLIRISTALTGRIRGGAAHAAIVASAVFGMMSGSVAANIAGTGVFTIPMIKKQGFSAKFAAAVETSASSGGQLTPPIMAAAVFVMADMLGKPYLSIITAAALPAIFKYISLFAQVYAEAIRLGQQPMDPADIPKLSTQDWINGLLVAGPIVALMTAFLIGFSPSMSGFIGLSTATVCGLVLSPKFRRQPMLILRAFADGGESAGKIMIAVAAIGIVLGVVNETGIAISFATSIAVWGEDYLFVALLIAMLGALILGMGLPTLPAYLIIAIMIAPAMIKSGVDPLAAHMFVLYYAVYSSIVPPIAYGCYVAAPIAGANPLATSFTALRLSIIGLLVPFVFVYTPSLLIVVDSFNYPDLISTMIRLLVAIWMFASCMGGSDPWRGLLSMPIRGLRLVVGFSLIFPQIEVWLVGLLLALVSQLVIRKTGP